MTTVDIHELDEDTLNKLIDKGRRFYVRTESTILPECETNSNRDAFWSSGDEQPVPVR